MYKAKQKLRPKTLASYNQRKLLKKAVTTKKIFKKTTMPDSGFEPMTLGLEVCAATAGPYIYHNQAMN